MAKIKEDESYTKPMGKPGDERIRPAKSDYTKFTKENPLGKEGYAGAGKKSIQKADGKERTGFEKVDYTKFTKENPLGKEGYAGVGKKSKDCGDGCERKGYDKVDYTKYEKSPKKTNPFKK